MTQSQLAGKCGVSTTTVSCWETGTKHPSQSRIGGLCRALGIPVSFLLMSSAEEQDFPSGKRVLFSAVLVPMLDELLGLPFPDETVGSHVGQQV